MSSTDKFYPQHAEAFAAILAGLKGKKVAVLGHIRPDGDCIGSQVALCRVLCTQGIEAICANGDDIPRTLKAFVGDTPFFKVGEIDINDYQVVSVDCADTRRVGLDNIHFLERAYANIDHHISNVGYAQHNIIDAKSAATGEILAGLFFDASLPIDAVTAQALYLGIATDTGQFRYQSTTRETFHLCCQLMDCGANPATAAYELYENESPGKLALLQRFLSTFRYACDGKVCIGLIENGAYEETGTHRDDSEGFTDYVRCIEGVEIGVLLEEKNGAIKGSFRANDPAHRVDQLAREFNGGGHAAAAGFNVEGNLKEFYPRLVKRLEEHFSTFAG